MTKETSLGQTPLNYLKTQQPDVPVLFFCPSILHDTARQFIDEFPGLVTFAVKSNPHPAVLENLLASGITTYDVASPIEIDLVRSILTPAALHYNNPIRSRDEINHGIQAGVISFSVDRPSELHKLAAELGDQPAEICVRFKLPMVGAAYDFGTKFGATPAEATKMLRWVSEWGYTPALSFHPGTQCEAPESWKRYIQEAADIAHRTGVTIARLNVGGGFPSDRTVEPVDLKAFFSQIDRTVKRAFADAGPLLVCEPGRGMVAEAMTLAVRVKAVSDTGEVFLNDGIYGLLTEFKDIGPVRRSTVISPHEEIRSKTTEQRPVFGLTCDSIDEIPGGLMLPEDIEDGDYLLFEGMGAYSNAITTAFNGYGTAQIVTVTAF